jgi:hypothetical protein
MVEPNQKNVYNKFDQTAKENYDGIVFIEEAAF